MIDVLNCGGNAHVQPFDSERVSPLPSHDHVRPSAPFRQTHIVLHQMQEATVVGFCEDQL